MLQLFHFDVDSFLKRRFHVHFLGLLYFCNFSWLILRSCVIRFYLRKFAQLLFVYGSYTYLLDERVHFEYWLGPTPAEVVQRHFEILVDAKIAWPEVSVQYVGRMDEIDHA